MNLLDTHDLLALFNLRHCTGSVDPIAFAQPFIAQTYVSIVGRFLLGSVEGLRAIMRASNCVVSGSYALHAFFYNGFQLGDLDFYVPSSSSAPLLQFVQSRGYRCVGTTADYPTHASCIDKVDHFRLPGADLKIDVVYSRMASPIQVIPHFHSTIVMNYLAWYRAVSLYPRLTLDKWGIINGAMQVPIKKYRKREFSLLCSLPGKGAYGCHECRRCTECPSTIRSIHDDGVLFVPLPGAPTSLAANATNLVWRLNNNTCMDDSSGFSVNERGEACE